MKFLVKDTLTEEDIQIGFSSIIRDGLTTQTMITLTGGVFLVAFALKLGASALVIGLLAAIAPLTNLIQIPSIFLVEKYRVRRAITLFASASSRIFLLLIALIPFLFSLEAGLIFLIIFLILNSSFSAISGCSWNSWMRDLVPQDRLGSFFSKRMSLQQLIGLPLVLAAGIYIDYWATRVPNSLYGFSTLFILGFLAGMLGIYFISTIPEPRMRIQEEKLKFYEVIALPFKNSNFKRLIIFLGSWNFAVNLAAPFFTVYMLQMLQLDLTVITALLVISQVMNLTFLRLWGRFSDRFSNKSVLGVSGPLFLGCILAWTFTTLPERYILSLPLLIFIHIGMGIATAGITLASGNIGLKLAPKGQATAYLATSSLISSLAAGIAPLLGGGFIELFARQELSLTLKWATPAGELAFQPLNFRQWDFFFVFAFLIGLYALHRLALVEEVGSVKEKIVLQELMSEIRREMRNLSTVGGLRQMIHFPFPIVRTIFKQAVSPFKKEKDKNYKENDQAR
jgi:MFS family permease